MSAKVIVLMGPMGCGKTTIGKLLAEKTGYSFADADDYHPVENKEKMAAGIPLNDGDRAPWLAILRGLIDEHLSDGRGFILACSALKEKYREQLGINQNEICSVYLRGSISLLAERIGTRSHEFMAKELLQSQLETLEEPEAGLTVDIAESPEQICQTIINKLIV